MNFRPVSNTTRRKNAAHAALCLPQNFILDESRICTAEQVGNTKYILIDLQKLYTYLNYDFILVNLS